MTPWIGAKALEALKNPDSLYFRLLLGADEGDSPGDETPGSIIVTRDGGYLLCSYITRPWKHSIPRSRILKLSATGQILWEKRLGKKERSVAAVFALETTKGEFLICGEASSKGGYLPDYWLVKLSPKGELLFERTYGGSSADSAKVIHETQEGHFILAGNSSPGASNAKRQSAVWMLKINDQGEKIWDRTLGSAQSAKINGLLGLEDGSLVLAGSSRPVGRNQRREGWLLKLDSKGKKLWERAYGSKFNDSFLSLEATPDNGFIACGYRELTPYFQGTSWIMKVNKEGYLDWEHTTGYRRATSIKKVSEGGYIMAGVAFEERGRGFGKNDLWIARLGSRGHPLWERRFGGVEEDQAESVAPSPDQGFILAGQTHSLGTGGKNLLVLKLDGLGRDSQALASHEDFNKVAKIGTLQAFEDFILAYPMSSEATLAQSGIFELEQARLSLLGVGASSRDFSIFIENHPKSSLIPRAKLRILEIRNFENAKKSQSKKELLDFLEKHPQSPLIPKAKNAIEALDFEKALNIGNPAVLNGFLKSYPKSRFTTGIQTGLYNHYKGLDSIPGFKEFLSLYPENPHREQGSNRLLYLRYIEAIRGNTVPSYEVFLKITPHSRYTRDLQLRLFRAYSSKNAVTGYLTFSAKHPQSRQARKSIQKAHSMVFKRSLASGTLLAMEIFQSLFPFAKQYPKAAQDSERLELKNMQKMLQKNGGTNAALDVARVVRAQAERALHRGESWIAARKVRLIRNQPPFRNTFLAYELRDWNMQETGKKDPKTKVSDQINHFLLAYEDLQKRSQKAANLALELLVNHEEAQKCQENPWLCSF